MLETKLQQASERNAKQGKRMLSILAIALFSGMLFVGISTFISNKSSQTVREDTVPVTHPSTAGNSALREPFMQQLQAYESGLGAEIAAANLKNWDSEKEAELTSLKNDAISAFAKGEYAAASQQLSVLQNMAKKTLQERDTRFTAQITAAEQALNADNYTKGKLHIGKALLLNPDNQAAQQLAKKIDALPQLTSLLKAANIARTENNPEKEYAAISKAVQLAPDRLELKQRRDTLAETLKEQKFSALISDGLQQVKTNHITAARSDYKQAKSLYSKRSELNVLNAAIKKTANAHDLKQAIATGKQAARNDDWQLAQSIYASASKRHPNDKTIQDGLQLANTIVSLQQSVAAYIRQPQRLASPNISKAAQNTLFQAGIFARNSPSLARNAAKLKRLIAGMQVDIPVFVKSDNETFILVRGVGKVGQTKGRTIQLKPGEYTFEGIRSGFKSKLVQVHLPIGATSFQVEVVCNERI